jgi:hypothetical protein
MDVEAISLGSDFREAVERSLDNCGVFLAIIGPSWLDARLPNDPSGPRRLDDPADFVRQEVGTALKRGSGAGDSRQKIPVIPVLVRGASMPLVDKLPGDLKNLAYRNALTLSHLDWDGNVQKLVAAIRPHIGEDKSEQHATAVSANGAATRMARAAAAQLAPEAPRPVGGMNKALLIGVPVLIVAAVIAYFALKPGPQPKVLPVTFSLNTGFQPELKCRPSCILSVDGRSVAPAYAGQALQMQLEEGKHTFEFANGQDHCQGSFVIASGQTTFVPQWPHPAQCALQPDEQVTGSRSLPPSTAQPQPPAAAPIDVSFQTDPAKQGAWEKRSLTIDDRVVSASMRGPVNVQLAPGQHKFLFTGPDHQCGGTFNVAPGRARFTLQWTTVEQCSLAPATE